MDSLKELLQGRAPEEPPEAVAAKRYIFNAFGAASSVTVQPNALVVTVASASLASALRMQLPKLQAACQTDKRFIFRIG